MKNFNDVAVLSSVLQDVYRRLLHSPRFVWPDEEIFPLNCSINGETFLKQ
jgi:hypothetical protein